MINSTQHSRKGKCLQLKYFSEVADEDTGGGAGGSAVQLHHDVIQNTITTKQHISHIETYQYHTYIYSSL